MFLSAHTHEYFIGVILIKCHFYVSLKADVTITSLKDVRGEPRFILNLSLLTVSSFVCSEVTYLLTL